ncbi:MAG: general secretion pathway protein GspC [Myxococcales bacterium]|nr:general secretion pathway protein GspC [Myxococcales bacterium]
MGIDGHLKRWYAAIVGGLIALAALFQASGLGKLAGAAMSKGAPVEVRVSAPSEPVATKSVSGLPILARNMFDSKTGPLDGTKEPEPGPESSEPEEALPLAELSEDAPNCSFGRVTLISASEDPSWSFAAIQESGGTTVFRRGGDIVAGHTVRAFSYNRVWLDDAGKQCQLKIGDKSTGAPAARTPPETEPAAPRKGAKGSTLAPELAAKIHKVSDTEFNVERSVVDEILENQAELMRSARIVPDKQGDKVLGVRLFGVRTGSLLHTLGLKNGDRLESINGFDMSDPQKALEAYGRLRTADALKVKVNRNSAPLTIDFNIQ